MKDSKEVWFVGPFDDGPGYPRPAALRAALAAIGVSVRDFRQPALGRIKQTLLQQPWRLPGLWLRQRRQLRHLSAQLAAALAVAKPVAVVVPYPGHFVVRDLAAVAHAAGVPVVLDLFLSLYDTVVEDRALVAPGSLLAHWLQRVETAACAAADLVLLDTPANAAYAAALTGLPPQRFAWLPLLDPMAPARPQPLPPPSGGKLELLFFGNGVPLHGLDHLLQAVAMVEGLRLTLVGGTATDRLRAASLPADRIQLEPAFVPPPRLQELLAASQLVAGVFGASGKAQRVVPWKVVHALAAGRPVVTADTPAIATWLEGSGAIWTVPAGDPVALARQLRELVAVPARLPVAATQARAAYDRHFGPTRSGQRWRELLQQLTNNAAVGAA